MGFSYFNILGLAVAVLIIVVVVSFFRSASSSPDLTVTEQRFLGVLRTALIWSAALSLICAILFGGLGVFSLVMSSLNTSDGAMAAYGAMGAAGLFSIALWCFGGFLTTMLVFVVVAIEMHLRRRA